MSQTNAILEADRQARWRLRAEQGTDKPRRSEWVVSRFHNYLSPEQRGTANFIVGLWETAIGVRETGERVDCAATDGRLITRIHAMRELHGYEQAALTRVNDVARRCMWAIAESENMRATGLRMGFNPRSVSAIKRLVQLTLITLAEYKEENEAAAKRWNLGA